MISIKHPYFFKILCFIILLLGWSILSNLEIWNPLLFPNPIKTIEYIYQYSYFIIESTYGTLKILGIALLISTCISLTVGSLAFQYKQFRLILEVLVSIINPIPGISLLPFAMLWFGLGENPILFVTVIGSLAVFILTIMNGFASISKLFINIGRIYCLNKWEMIFHIYIPASLPSIITGLKAAWGISWRSLVAAELVYGAMGESGGLGWLITINRFNLNPNGMAAGIISIIIIGFIIEHGLLGIIENKTIKKWGMKI